MIHGLLDDRVAALLIFFAAYGCFIFLPARRMLVALGAGALLLLIGVVSPGAAFASINWNVIGIFVGNLMIADVLIESRAPAYLAEIIVDRSKNTAWAIIFICLLTGAISAFVDNVATVLLIAPVALALAKKLKFNPTKMMIGVAISSNLQGAATLIGDTPSMLLGTAAGMSFTDFFWYQGKPSIFFAVQFGALASFIVLYFVYRTQREKLQLIPVEKVQSWFPTVLLVALIFTLAGASFFKAPFAHGAGIICLVAGTIALVWQTCRGNVSFFAGLKSLDYDTTFFLVGIFVLVGSLTRTGWIDSFGQSLSGMVGSNVFLGYTIIVFVSVLLSAFVDNIPYLAAMLPVVTKMSAAMQVNPTLFYFGLLLGASLGGNITPFGASANIAACGMLKKEGYTVRFGEFTKIGLPFTLAAVIAAYLLVWFIWR
jgi:Na+/H+ antiporter NhaD/arsenite permease-like protein